MGKLPYENYIFDLYGTLVDIHTEEDRPEAWAALARFYSYYGADYAPGELQQAFRRMTAERTAGREAPRREGHEAFPEIEIEEVFLALFRQKGAPGRPGWLRCMCVPTFPPRKTGRRPTSRCPPWTSPPWAAC